MFLGENGLNHQLECSILSSIDKDKRPSFNASIKDEAGNSMISLVPEYPAILPIRTLKLKETNPSLWNRVDLLMDHSEDITPEQQEKIKTNVVDFIRENCNQSSKYSEKEIVRAVGILSTNGVNQGMMLGHGLYPTFSFISHSCQNNSRFQIHHDRRIVLRALKNISRGEEITTIYLSPLMGNVLRRNKIKYNWKFDCTCSRCKDKTEFGTFVNAVLCMKCRNSEQERNVENGKMDIVNGVDKGAEPNIENDI